MKTEKDLVLLYIFNFFKSLQFFGAVAVPFYLVRIGLDYTGMFTLEAVFSFSMMAFEIPTGVVADRWGRKMSLFAGSLFFGAGFLMFGLFTSFAVLLAAEVVCAFGMTMLSGADRALTYEILKARGEEGGAARVMARYDAFGTAGLALAFPAGSFFVTSGVAAFKAALGLVFVATAAAVGLAGLVVIFVREEIHEKNPASAIRQGVEGFLFVFGRKGLRAFALDCALVSSMTFFMFWFYQSLLLESGFPVGLLGFVASAFNLSALVMLLLLPAVERKFGVGRTLFLTSFVPGLFYVLPVAVPGPAAALAAIFVVTNLRAFRAPLLSALMNAEIGDSDRATVLSGVSMIERVATMLLYPVVGLFADVSLGTALLLLGALTTLLSVLLRAKGPGARRSKMR